MPKLNGYTYTLEQCDVPEERRPELQRFRDKRRVWLTWLDFDEQHAIWQTLSGMVWREVALKTLASAVEGYEESALNNPLIVEALLEGHVATQVLAIRRLVEDTQKDRISLRRLVKDVRRCFDLFTRENYVCFDGLPFDYELVRDRNIETIIQQGGMAWMPFEGPESDGASELMHIQFDKLSGVHSTKRSRLDHLPYSLLTTIDNWLDASHVDELEEWSHAYLAHAGGPTSREKNAHVKVTANKISAAIRGLARAAEAASLIVYAGGRAGSFMPVAQYDQFAKLASPVVLPDKIQNAHDHWHKLAAEWGESLVGVEDELRGLPG